MTQKELHNRVRVSYVKVAEYQRRGALHFHVVVRLDGGGEDVEPPPERFGVDLLEEAVRAAVGAARAPYPELEGTDASPKPLRWGGQIEIRVLADGQEQAPRGQVADHCLSARTRRIGGRRA